MMQYKINLHVTDSCNYHCRYCFAHFGKKKDLPLKSWKKIIDNIKNSGLVNAINFAGGEPVLYHDFLPLTTYAKEAGFNLSLISNGSLLLKQKYTPPILFEQISTLGVSIDSFRTKTLRALGCCDIHKNVLSKEHLVQIIATAKKINSTIKIKLNTVVSKLNKDEILPHIENDLPISRWKFLKIKAFHDGSFSNTGLLITDEDFSAFISRNTRTQDIVIPEKTLTRSYIMIDSQGNLVDDIGLSYKIVGNLLTEDFAEVFQRYEFNEQSYRQRY